MHPFRIAILIFFLGATTVNVLATKMRHDSIATNYPVAFGTLPPLDDSSPSATDEPFGVSQTPNPFDNPSAHSAVDPSALKQNRLVDDAAWLREAAIATVAGVAWFVVKAKT